MPLHQRRRPRRAALVAAALAASTVAAATPGEERWEGGVDLPTGALDILVTLHEPAEPGGPPLASIDIPAQSVTAVRLRDVVHTEAALAFTLETGPAEAQWATFDLQRDPPGGDRAAGVMTQLGMEFDVALRRLAPDEPPTIFAGRPQDPQPPFPYDAKDLNFNGADEGVRLAGTLTIPRGDGPFPGVILVTGSGPQDRDETLMGHKPFLVLADHLTRRGVAVLRYDERGVKASSGDFASATTLDFAADAANALSTLASQPRVDPARVGVVGHSEGALVAPIVAAEAGGPAFIVMLAGTGVPGDEILNEQAGALLAAAGAEPAGVAFFRRTHRRFLDELTAPEPDDAALHQAFRMLARAEAEALGVEAPPLPGPAIDARIAAFRTPWFEAFFTLDPRDYLRRTACPVLVVNGMLDRQVVPEQNIGPIVGALREGGNEAVTVHILPGLNHLFQTAATGGMDEYAKIDETFAPAALELISSWILRTAGGPGPDAGPPHADPE